MRIIATSKSPNEVLINVFSEENSAPSAGDPGYFSEYTTEFWCGHMFTASSRSEEHVCAICGKKTPADRGKGLALGKSARVASWIDITRPEGDTRLYAHLECLEKVHMDQDKWPAGVMYYRRRNSTARIAQQRAIKRLIAEGTDKIDAWKLCSYRDGEPPKIIGEVLNREFAPLPSDVVDPMLGDVVRFSRYRDDRELGVVTGIKRYGTAPAFVTEIEPLTYFRAVEPGAWADVIPVRRASGEDLRGKRYRA